MLTLYHYPLCPFSRKIRFVLAEKNIEYQLKEERFWEKNEYFVSINPLGQIPVLINNNYHIIDSNAIFEYLEELYPTPKLLSLDLEEKAEARFINAWFDQKFFMEITNVLLTEKVFSRLSYSAKGSPDSNKIRTTKSIMNEHFEYLEWIIKRRPFLAKDFFSIADITVAAHISVIDYLGDIMWNKFSTLYMWYMRIKSRPAFTDILNDKIPLIKPSSHYRLLDHVA